MAKPSAGTDYAPGSASPSDRKNSPIETPEQSKPGHSYKQIASGILSAVAGRGVAVVTSFFAVPLTIHYLGAERYGVWIALSSILAYLTVFDLGIGSTAINGVSEALANDNLAVARQRINTAYATLTLIAVGIAAIVLLAWPLIPWPSVLGDKSGGNQREISVAAGIAIAMLVVGFPLSVTPRIMGACHKITLANYWNSFGSLLGLMLLIVVTRLKAGLPGLVAALSCSALVVGIGSTVWLYRHFQWLTARFRDVRWSGIRELLGTALPYFAVQVSGIILFQTDNLIIAQIMGASAVTPYSITWKLFSYATLLQVLALPTLWPAYADAFARSDFSWIRKTYRYNLLTAVGSTAVFVLLLLLLARKFIAVWAGPAAVPSFGLVAGMGAWTLLASLSWCESCILGAAGHVKGQAIYSAIGALVNVVSSIMLARIFGLVGIILGTLLAYSVCIIVPQTWEVHNLLKEKRVPA